MNHNALKKWGPIIFSVLAILFGVITLIAGSRILLNLSDPGYIVFKPLIIFNTLMGFIYVWAGGVILNDIHKGIKISKWLVILNLIVLITIATIYWLTQEVVAIESLYAMTFRTVLWVVIFSGLSITNSKTK